MIDKEVIIVLVDIFNSKIFKDDHHKYFFLEDLEEAFCNIRSRKGATVALLSRYAKSNIYNPTITKWEIMKINSFLNEMSLNENDIEIDPILSYLKEKMEEKIPV